VTVANGHAPQCDPVGKVRFEVLGFPFCKKLEALIEEAKRKAQRARKPRRRVSR